MKKDNKLKSTHLSINGESITKSKLGYDIINSKEPAEHVQEGEIFQVNNQIYNNNNINNISNKNITPNGEKHYIESSGVDIDIHNDVNPYNSDKKQYEKPAAPVNENRAYRLQTSEIRDNINDDINKNINNESRTPGEDKYIITSSGMDSNIHNYINSYNMGDKTNEELKLEIEKLRRENDDLKRENKKLKNNQNELKDEVSYSMQKQIKLTEENEALKESLKALQDKIIKYQQQQEEQRNKDNTIPKKTTKSVSGKGQGKGQ